MITLKNKLAYAYGPAMQKFPIDMDIRRLCRLIRTKCGLNEECLHKHHLTKYCGRQREVKSIGLFGSYAKGAPVEASDVYVVVQLARPICLRFIEFTEYLEELLENEWMS